MQKNSIVLKNIRKCFGSKWANDGINLSVDAATIHALVGENGAGKSTAMKILFGQLQADEGEILVGGSKVHFASPRAARAAGVGMVHQHFLLAETHTGLENIILGSQTSPLSPIDWEAAREKVQKIMLDFKVSLPLELPLSELAVGSKQMVEILKLLFEDSQILILDEPTALLSPPEIEALFQLLLRLKEEGRTIIFITHKLKEVMAWSDAVTVIRAGKTVAARNTKETSSGELAQLMVGEIPPYRERSFGAASSKTLLEAKHWKVNGIEPISFRLREGEILGVAGVEGNGQSQLMQAILFPSRFGDEGLHLLGKEGHKIGCIRDLKVGVIPEDRLGEALVPELSLEKNFLLGQVEDFSRRGKIDFSLLRSTMKQELENFSVSYANSLQEVGSLSGGNQQKFVVARELRGRHPLLIASHPTRGVDIGSVAFIHQKLEEERARGVGILLFSADLDELIKLSDRLLVMYRGKVVGAFAREEFKEEAIGKLMGGIL